MDYIINIDKLKKQKFKKEKFLQICDIFENEYLKYYEKIDSFFTENVNMDLYVIMIFLYCCYVLDVKEFNKSSLFIKIIRSSVNYRNVVDYIQQIQQKLLTSYKKIYKDSLVELHNIFSMQESINKVKYDAIKNNDVIIDDFLLCILENIICVDIIKIQGNSNVENIFSTSKKIYSMMILKQYDE